MAKKVSEKRIEEVLHDYVIAALWSTPNNDSENEEYLEENYSIEDFDEKTLDSVRAKIKKFIEDNYDAIEKSGTTDEQLGHDLWLSSNGHGAGFFDRGYDKDVEDKLMESARKLGGIDLEVGDDGKIYALGVSEKGSKIENMFKIEDLKGIDIIEGEEQKTIHSINLDTDLNILEITYGNSETKSFDGEEINKLLSGEEVNGIKIYQEEQELEEIEEEEEEQNAFNNAELFLEEYGEYLVGKKINADDVISQIKSVSLEDENNDAVNIETDNGYFRIYSDEFQDFIDGEVIGITDDDEVGLFLVLQEEPVIEETTVEEVKIESFNKPEFRYYLVCEKGKIFSGYEYQEDAKANKKHFLSEGRSFDIASLKDLQAKGIDVNDNANWCSNVPDYDFISSIDENGIGIENRDDKSKEHAALRILESALDRETKQMNKYLILGSQSAMKNFYDSKKKIERILSQLSILINK